MKFIIGLGNPGLKYRRTRHNAGFMALDFLIDNLSDSKKRWRLDKKLKSKVTELTHDEQQLFFIKPQTYMNRSGEVISLLKKKYPRFDPSDLIVIYDDIDLEFGKIRVKEDSSSGGHNGIKSLIQHLGSQEFKRIKIGVSDDLRNKLPADKFVLSRFPRDEHRSLDNIFDQLAKSFDQLI